MTTPISDDSLFFIMIIGMMQSDTVKMVDNVPISKKLVIAILEKKPLCDWKNVEE